MVNERAWFTAVVVGMCVSFAPGYDWSTNPGDGSMENPYQISTPEQLIAVPQGGNRADHYYVLVNDIVFDPNNPAHRGSSGLPKIQCQFDGAGFAVRNLTLQTTTPHNAVGLFSHVQHPGRVKNLRIENASIEIGAPAEYVGILCGHAEGDIVNCSVEGTLSGPMAYGGGICGQAGSAFGIEIAYCAANVTFDPVDGVVGGICGRAFNVNLHRNRAICRIVGGISGGGICGRATGHMQIRFCEAELFFTTDRIASEVGGICGYFDLQSFKHGLEGCSAVVDIVSQSRLSYAGGMCGIIYGPATQSSTITRSSARGKIDGRALEDVGGFVGYNGGTISDSYAQVDIVGDAMYNVGGFIGRNWGMPSSSYCAGEVQFNSPYPADWYKVAEFCGMPAGFFEACYWDIQKCDLNSEPPAGLTGLTTEQMQTRATYEQAGWDFDDEPVWGIRAGCYPHLVFKTFSGGSGRPDDPFLIASAEDLIELGQSPRYYSDCFAQTNDIDLSEYVFTDSVIAPGQVRGDNSYAADATFFGTFDGRGYRIENLTIHNPLAESNSIGLFGRMFRAIVRNVSLENVTINVSGGDVGLKSIGGLLGHGSGLIQRCRVTGTVNAGEARAGGIVGYSGGVTMLDCYFKGQVNGKFSGGIFGLMEMGNMYRCYASAEIEGQYRGGLIGVFGYSAFSGNSVWDSELSGVSEACGYVSAGSDMFITNVRGLTCAQMKTAGGFADLGWSFVGSGDGGNHIWRMCADGVDTPRLSWEFARGGDLACPDGVELGDLLALAQAWLTIESGCPKHFNTAADANIDGRIDLLDFIVLSDNWP